MTPHCETCICGKRAPVQKSAEGGTRNGNGVWAPARGPGSISWEEHLLAWSAYALRYGTQQSAERIAERGGFSYWELVDQLGYEPKTWTPR